MAQEIKLWNNAIGEDQEGESGLPPVTSEDEGKVLSVNDEGEWAAAEVSNDSGFVEINAQCSSGDNITLEEGAFAKLSDAFTNNKLVLVKVGGTMSFSVNDIIIPVAFSSSSDPSSFISLEGGTVTRETTDLYGVHILITGGSWSIEGSILSKKIT